jgi:16S rRNA (cytosine967-C5)-methyltransferase
MAYTGIGERTALLKSSKQLHIDDSGDLRQAHKWIMETNRFQNGLDWLISSVVTDDGVKEASHGIRSLLRILAYMKLVGLSRRTELERTVAWGRQVIGWRELLPYEEALARLVSTRSNPPITQLPEFERLALETSHPAWYVRRLVTIFGRSFALRNLTRDLNPVSSFARLNTLKAQDEPVLTKRFQGTRIEGVDGTYLLNRPVQGDERTRLASSGMIVIQDLGSIVAGLVASPLPGQVVLDVCAAPGNKTSHMAAQMKNDGEIFSVEISRSRSAQWKREMARTGCTIANLIRGDARKLSLHNEADVVLVDPPCSNSGVFARNPANKWRVTPARLRELTHSQSEILQAASENVTEGGTLVYCTCSILPEENEIIVETFLKRKPQFTLIPQTPFTGSPGLRGLIECQRFFSCIQDCNGSFIAKMRKFG